MNSPKISPKLVGKSYRVWGVVGLVAVALLSVLYWTWSDVPQLNADDDVLRNIDGLFTAVTARSKPLLAECERKLNTLHQEGRIPEPAWKKLSQFIESAKKDQWETASQRLYGFIEMQKGTPRSK